MGRSLVSYLLREDPCILKSFTKQIYLGDHTAVGYHHRDRTKHRFQIIGKLGATSVSRIHRYEYTAGVNEADLRALEDEFVQSLSEGRQYR